MKDFAWGFGKFFPKAKYHTNYRTGLSPTVRQKISPRALSVRGPRGVSFWQQKALADVLCFLLRPMKCDTREAQCIQRKALIRSIVIKWIVHRIFYYTFIHLFNVCSSVKVSWTWLCSLVASYEFPLKSTHDTCNTCIIYWVALALIPLSALIKQNDLIFSCIDSSISCNCVR